MPTPNLLAQAKSLAIIRVTDSLLKYRADSEVSELLQLERLSSNRPDKHWLSHTLFQIGQGTQGADVDTHAVIDLANSFIDEAEALWERIGSNDDRRKRAQAADKLAKSQIEPKDDIAEESLSPWF